MTTSQTQKPNSSPAVEWWQLFLLVLSALVLGAAVGGYVVGGSPPNWLDIASAFGSAFAWVVTTIFAVIAGLFVAFRYFEDQRQARQNFINEKRYALISDVIDTLMKAKEDISPGSAPAWLKNWSPKIRGAMLKTSFASDRETLAKLDVLFAAMLKDATRDSSNRIAADLSAATENALDDVVVTARTVQDQLWGDTDKDANIKILIASVQEKAWALRERGF